MACIVEILITLLVGKRVSIFIYLFIDALFNEDNILQCQCTAFQAGPHLDYVLQYLQ